MTNLPIIDQPRWPAMDAETTPAFLDFKLVLRQETKGSSMKTRLGNIDLKASRLRHN